MGPFLILLIFLQLMIANSTTVFDNRLIRTNRAKLQLGNLCDMYDKTLGTCTLQSECCDQIYNKIIMSTTEFSYITNNKCVSSAVCCSLNVNSLLPNSTSCGKSSSDFIFPRVYGGEEIQPGDFPWMARLKYERNFDKKIIYMCGGSLISQRYILTAAHCFYHIDNAQFKYEVRLGEINDDSTDKNQPLNVHVEKRIVHENYREFQVPKNDIALLRLRTTIEFTYYISPICLPIGENYIHQNYINKELTIVGWGATETGSFSTEKLRTNVKCVTNSGCIADSSKTINLDKEKQLCAGGDGEKDSCNGDSGCPLMHQDQQIWKIVGIVSYGPYSCASKEKPAVYTRVDAFIPWIIQKIHK